MSGNQTKQSLRKRKQDLLSRIYHSFSKDSSYETTHQIVTKLIHHNRLRYSLKSSIIDPSFQYRDRADKLFDFVYKSDVNVIDVFLDQIKEIFPHIYRTIEYENKVINSDFAGSTPNEDIIRNSGCRFFDLARNTLFFFNYLIYL